MNLTLMLKYFFRLSHLPLAVYEKDNLILSLAVHPFTPNPISDCIFELAESEPEKHMDITLEKHNLICGFIRDKKSNSLIVVGPAVEFTFAEAHSFVVLKDMKQPVNRSQELVNFFSKIPNMSLVTFYHNLTFLNYIINEEQTEDDYMDKRIEDMLGYGEELELQKRPMVRSIGTAEFQLLSCVEFGDLKSLDQVMRFQIPQESGMGRAADNSVHSIRNIIIASVAVIARQAAKGGMDYEEAMNLSDKYLQKLDVISDYDGILEIWGEAIYDYTSRVNKIRSLSSDSYLVQRINGYILHHIYGTLTIEEIAEHMNKNISYLCRVFKSNTGRTMRDYIAEIKIEEAKKLLSYTEDEILKISLDLGFSSQAYFTTVFKKRCGMTPAEYRKSRIMTSSNL